MQNILINLDNMQVNNLLLLAFVYFKLEPQYYIKKKKTIQILIMMLEKTFPMSP